MRFQNKIGKIMLVLLLGMFLISLVSATNISILYGKNTSSGEMVPVEVNDDGSLKTTLDLTESTGLIPKLDNAYNIGTAVLRWAKGYFFNFNIDNNLTVVGNVTADYYFGDGSQLTNVGGVEVDPYWTGNQSLYYLKSNPFGFYNLTSFEIDDYYLKNNPFGFYNLTSFEIDDYYLKNNPFGFYNSTNPQTETDPLWTGNETNVSRIGDCPAGEVVMNTTTGGVECVTLTGADSGWNVSGTNLFPYSLSYDIGINTTTPQNKLNVVGDINFTGLIYGNGSQLTGIEGLGAETDPLWTGNQSLYYLKSNPFGFWNSTFALFNKTYADTLYLTSYTETDPLWTANQSSYWDTSTDLDTVISADEISEANIAFSTACAAGNHYYLNGDDLACEADDYNAAFDTAGEIQAVAVGGDLSGTVGSASVDNNKCAADQVLEGDGTCVTNYEVGDDGDTDSTNELDNTDYCSGGTCDAPLAVAQTAAKCTSADCNDAVYSEGTIQSVCTDCIGDSQLLFNTGQALTTGSSPTFDHLTIDGTGTAYDAPGGLAIFQDDGDRQIAIGGLGIFRRDGASNADLRINYLGYNGGATQFRDFDIYDGKTNKIASFDGSVDSLDMNNNNIINVNKIDASTYDPVYDIDGTKYATYLSGMAGGVKEEITGTVMLNSSYTIDFKNLEIGSDLWLFYQITDFGQNMDKLQVILTPSFNGNVWYEKNPLENILTIHGDSSGEVSYRMTANRFDWSKWGTYYEGESTGMVLNGK